MTDYRPRFLSALLAQKQAQGKPLNQEDYLNTCQVIAEIIEAETAEQVRKECLAVKKQRKKEGINPQAAAILNVYPRREGGDAALVSISKAIAKDGFDRVLEKTAEYSSAVARWSYGRKRDAKGASLIPMATTFFKNHRYNDDSKEWWEGTGGKPKTETVETLPEPQGWRFAHPESRFVKDNEPWERIDLITQRWIIQNTPKQAQTA